MSETTPLTEEREARKAAAKAMWESGPTTARRDWDTLTDRQREMALHEANAVFDAAKAFYSERERALREAANELLEAHDDFSVNSYPADNGSRTAAAAWHAERCRVNRAVEILRKRLEPTDPAPSPAEGEQREIPTLGCRRDTQTFLIGEQDGICARPGCGLPAEAHFHLPPTTEGVGGEESYESVGPDDLRAGETIEIWMRIENDEWDWEPRTVVAVESDQIVWRGDGREYPVDRAKDAGRRMRRKLQGPSPRATEGAREGEGQPVEQMMARAQAMGNAAAINDERAWSLYLALKDDLCWDSRAKDWLGLSDSARAQLRAYLAAADRPARAPEQLLDEAREPSDAMVKAGMEAEDAYDADCEERRRDRSQELYGHTGAAVQSCMPVQEDSVRAVLRAALAATSPNPMDGEPS